VLELERTAARPFRDGGGAVNVAPSVLAGLADAWVVVQVLPPAVAPQLAVTVGVVTEATTVPFWSRKLKTS